MERYEIDNQLNVADILQWEQYISPIYIINTNFGVPFALHVYVFVWMTLSRSIDTHFAAARCGTDMR
jgi:hypothetical protein